MAASTSPGLPVEPLTPVGPGSGPSTLGNQAVPMTSPWILAAILAGLMVVEGVRQGGFWRPDALVVAAASLIILLVQLGAVPLDRRGWTLIGSLFLLTLWWLVRAATAGPANSFLPLGASLLGFMATFVVVRSLEPVHKEVAAQAVAGLGAAGAIVGFVGLIWRWYPIAMPSQNLWRLATTLTYADTAGLVLAVSLLLALGAGTRPWMVRLSVCLCAGGLLATQSRGPLVALACAAAVVPLSQYRVNLVPLTAGVGLGVVAIATSGSSRPAPWLGVAMIVALAVSLAWTPRATGPPVPRARVFALAAVGIIAVAGSLALLHHQIELRAWAPSNGDRAVEWSAGIDQFESSPVVGVGPDRLLQFHAADGTYAHFVHNEYLQMAADTGLVGVVLLVSSGVALARVVRRVDVMTSCAVAALVCWAVAGAFDFDWHLPVVGLIGGWVAGLATRRSA